MIFQPAPANPDGHTINSEILVNVASQCNFRCTYCHWFKDPTVLSQPVVMSEVVEDSFVSRLEDHIRRYGLKVVTIVVHGGEPLLFGKDRFRSFAAKLYAAAERSQCSLHISITTNGSLIDAAWLQVFIDCKVSITVSIDGDQSTHDLQRLSYGGHGTFDQVRRGIERLQKAGLKCSTLAVCNPVAQPAELLDFFFNDLCVTAVDFLIPKINHDDKKRGAYREIATFYSALFDEWYDKYWQRDLRVRICEEMIRLLLGRPPSTHALRADRMTHVSISPDGTIEPLDNLRIGGNKLVNTGLNIVDNRIDDVLTNPLWLRTYDMARTLPSGCDACEYVDCCHGGFIACRWADDNGYNNRTVYCDDIKKILAHAWKKIQKDLVIAHVDDGATLIGA